MYGPYVITYGNVHPIQVDKVGFLGFLDSYPLKQE